MRAREWNRCTDPHSMLRDVDLPLHLMPNYPAHLLSIHLRRLRVFTLTAAEGVLTRLDHPICRTAAEVGWQLAEGTAQPDEVVASREALRVLFDEAITFDNLELARFVNVLALFFVEPDGAAARTLMDRQHPLGGGQLCPLVTAEEERHCCVLLREIFGARRVTYEPVCQAAWATSTAVAIAQQMYESRDFSAMPILADALQDAGCDDPDILDHCRASEPHVRGCWVVDLILGKE